MRKRILELIFILLAAALISTIINSQADAATFRGNETTCTAVAQLALDVSQMRDAGVTLEQLEPWFVEQLAKAKNDPTSYIKDDEDATFVLTLVKRIFAEPILDRRESVLLAYRDCMRKKAGTIL